MSENGLAVDGLSVSFGGLQALQRVTFEVAPGRIVGVMGPNGAGKTTLFNLITGIYRPSAGVVRFAGRELQALSPAAICRSGIARTFQSGRPFTNMTARDNVLSGLFYGCARMSRADAAAEAARLLDFVGLGRQADRPVSSLNLMERKIVELARALATRPKLLLLDELLAGLNPSDLGSAIGIIRKIRDELGITVFWIEHIMQVLMNTCEHLIVLHHGEKLAEGAPQAVVGDPQVAEAYFGKKGRAKLV
jgi:branched-chain amino acid transport system ATP-binding protein